jgi:hypothetical protein
MHPNFIPTLPSSKICSIFLPKSLIGAKTQNLRPCATLAPPPTLAEQPPSFSTASLLDGLNTVTVRHVDSVQPFFNLFNSVSTMASRRCCVFLVRPPHASRPQCMRLPFPPTARYSSTRVDGAGTSWGFIGLGQMGPYVPAAGLVLMPNRLQHGPEPADQDPQG